MDSPVNPRDLPEKSRLASYLTPKKLITWVNGMPIPYTEWVLPKNRIDEVFLAALALPYAGTQNPHDPDDILYEPEYEGLTNIEVAAIKTARKAAAGDTEALKFTIERLLGKPRQSIDQTTVTVSLTDYLERLDLETKAQEWDKKVVDVAATPVTPNPEKWDI